MKKYKHPQSSIRRERLQFRVACDYGGLFVEGESDDSSVSDVFEEVSQSDEENHDVALMRWKDDCLLIGNSSSDSNLDSDSDEDEMLQDRANEQFVNFNDKVENSDDREGCLFCQFPNCAKTFMGITFGSHGLLASHAKHQHESTLICQEPQCSERQRLLTANNLAAHRRRLRIRTYLLSDKFIITLSVQNSNSPALIHYLGLPCLGPRPLYRHAITEYCPNKSIINLATTTFLLILIEGTKYLKLRRRCDWCHWERRRIIHLKSLGVC